MFGKKEIKLTLEEKVDLLLKYQKQARFWATIRGIFGFVMFMIFIVLPIVATVYIWDDLMAYMDTTFKQYESALNGLQTAGEISAGSENIDLNALMEKMGMVKTD